MSIRSRPTIAEARGAWMDLTGMSLTRFPSGSDHLISEGFKVTSESGLRLPGPKYLSGARFGYESLEISLPTLGCQVTVEILQGATREWASE